MPYIGNSPNAGNQRKLDSPLPRFGSGTGFNGVQTIFLMQVGGENVYPGQYQLLAVLNDSVLEPNVDYSISNERITFTNPPQPTDTFFAIIFGDQLDIGTVSDGSITTSKFLDLSISTAKIADSAVTEQKIADDAVTNAKLADDSVTTAKIVDRNVTVGKLDLSSGTLPSPIYAGQIAYLTTDNFYYVTKKNSQNVLYWEKLLDREEILNYVDYGDSVRDGNYVIDGTTYDYNDNYMLDSSSGSFTIDLAKTPNTGDFIRFVDVTNRWSINNITIDSTNSGSNLKDYLDNVDSQLIFDDDGWEVLLVYNGTHWKIVV